MINLRLANIQVGKVAYKKSFKFNFFPNIVSYISLKVFNRQILNRNRYYIKNILKY